MFKKTLIAATLAIAAPAVFAQSATGSTTTNSSSQNNTPGISVQGGTTATPPAGAADKTGALGVGGGFSALDRNGDGSIGRDEVAGNASLSSKFAQYDTDKNGSLSNAEFSKFESTSQSKGDKLKDKADNLNSPKDVDKKIKDNNQPSDLK